MEQTLFNSLFTLLRDTAVLRDYTRQALGIVQECYAMAGNAYGQSMDGADSTMHSQALQGSQLPALPYATQEVSPRPPWPTLPSV